MMILIEIGIGAAGSVGAASLGASVTGSVGAVVGQIAGAYYGVKNIPPEWIQTISQWDNYEIPLRGYILQKLIKS